MNHARAGLADRAWETAIGQCVLAERNAASPLEREQVKRLRALHDQLRQFFAFVQAGLQKLEPTEELSIGDWVAVVVEVETNQLALFVEGSRRDYTLATLPGKLALLIAEWGADPSMPEVMVARGAFLAVDPEGDRPEAQHLWKAAARAGANVHDLLPLLEPQALAVEREPVPDAAALALAGEKIDVRFAEAIATVKSARQKTELAAQWRAAADEATTSAAQFALLSRAGDLAADAGDAPGALAAIDAMARWFQMDALARKTESLCAAAASVSAAPAAKEVARHALDLADMAEKSQRTELAATLIKTAVVAARKARDPALLQRVKERQGGDKPRATLKKFSTVPAKP